ncbi:galactose-1-epimerase [Photobacterium rosenbergii]|uniref:Aldose 1-epimerase n=1 Tax=Photobacterium rosenbergii TaxID=294936 RepID=A0A2T3N9U3_9GAMM|nr:aldose epimerase family protein [Photobacterium rosenbergii]PSW10287.1 galactose-1-epimerase [Photobacterium rosenbergii]
MKLYRIENKGIKIDISPIGASIVNFFVHDKHGVERNIVLGYDSSEKYQNNGTYFGAVVGPIANRVANGEFMLDGRKRKLTQNDGTNHLHGGDANLNSRTWEVLDRTDKGILLSVRVARRDGGYPVDIVISVAYFLSDNGALSIRYTATPAGRCPLNITQHAYFNLNGSGDILDHELWINADSILAVDDKLIPTGQLSVRGNAFDFTSPRQIGEAMSTKPLHRQLEIANGGYDHCYVLNRDAMEQDSMRVTSPKTGISLHVQTDLPGVQFYSGNFLNSEAGRQGETYNKHAGLCLETQHFPNQVNTNGAERCIYDVQRPFISTTIYRVEVS